MAFFDKAGDAEPATPREIGELDPHARTCQACLHSDHSTCKVHRLCLVGELQIERDHAAQFIEVVGGHEEPRAADTRYRACELHRLRIVVGPKLHAHASTATSICYCLGHPYAHPRLNRVCRSTQSSAARSMYQELYRNLAKALALATRHRHSARHQPRGL